MITEEQANKIIELLIKIETNTSNTEANCYNLDHIQKDVLEIKSLLKDKK